MTTEGRRSVDTPPPTPGLQARLGAAAGLVRRNAANTGLELLINFAAPYAIFCYLKPTWGDVHALMASSAPPIAWSVIEFARKRRVDALSILVLTGIALSMLAYLGSGGVRFLQLRERLVTGAIGLVFLGSVAVGRPLIYYLARATMLRRNQAAQVEEFEGMRDNPFFKRTMRVMTLVWGAGLITECAVATTLVFTLTIKQFLLVSPIVGYSFGGGLGLWTFLYARHAQRLGATRRAAAQAAAATEAQAAPSTAA